ncbi:hypothetical protein Agabi119p4_9617 [Agaricus bisporus var. burnettii]|uniref:WD40 repeat-like protein n=1 Tax=Agaricus bisporus var. burnettii TaxID=192524 RepID=A0A8H7C441_AGABI|nr:hypothetical protein Agabi119p4_9617 [Agaricus bisporus var. burnettii]
MTSPMALPILTVQSDFADVIADVDAGLVPEDRFWLSCYKSGEPSVHAKVHVALDDVDRNLIRFTPKDGDVDFVKTQSTYTAACHSLDIPPTPILLPTQEYTDTDTRRPRRITAFDISLDKSRFAIGHLDGSLSIHPISPPSSTPKRPQRVNTSNKRKLVSKPHVSNITHLQFFPSSRVLLSSGADFSLSILSTEFPDAWQTSSSETSSLSVSGSRIQPVRVLRGHTRSVTSATIIDRGRNIISSSLDSSLNLWDIPSGSVIHTLNSTSPVLCTTIGTNEVLLPPDGEEEEKEVGIKRDEMEDEHVQQTVSYAGLQNGSIQVFDWRTRLNFSLSKPPSSAPINSISYLPQQSLLATGSSKGIITLYDVRSLSSSSLPLTSFRRNEAGISDLAFQYRQQRVGLAIATADGLPYIASIIPEGPGIQTELVGVDCDPVGNIRVVRGDSDDQEEVWTASDDGIVRRYIL